MSGQPAWQLTVIKLLLVAFVLLLGLITRAALVLQPRRFEVAFHESAQTRSWLRRYDRWTVAVGILMALLHNKWPSRVVEVRRVTGVTGGHPWLLKRYGALFHVGVCTSLYHWVLLTVLPPSQHYHNHRRTIVLVSRLLRMTVAVALTSVVVCGEPNLLHVMFRADVEWMAKAPPALVLLRILIFYSGATHAFMQSVQCLLPSSHSTWPHVTHAAIICFTMSPTVTQLMAEHPVAEAALQGLCRALLVCANVLMVLQPSELRCSPQAMEALLCFVGVMMGCVMPMIVQGYIEYRAKAAFAKHVGTLQNGEGTGAPQQQQPDMRAAPHGNHAAAAHTGGMISLGHPQAWRWASGARAMLQAICVVCMVVMERLLLMDYGPVAGGAGPHSDGKIAVAG